MGHLLENQVYLELKKNIRVGQKLAYWRTRQQTEVDFVLAKDDRLLPIEVKRRDTEAVPKNIVSFCEKYACPHAIVLNKNFWHTRQVGQTQVHFLPAFLAGKVTWWFELLSAHGALP